MIYFSSGEPVLFSIIFYSNVPSFRSKKRNYFFFILGPTTLSKCGNLTLSGLLSSGGGGRRLNFLWSLKPHSTAAFNITNSDRVLIIPGDLLTAGASYEFQLGVSNFLNPTYFENVTHSVVKSPDPVPFLSLSSSVNLETGEVFVSEDLIIKVTAEVSV